MTITEPTTADRARLEGARGLTAVTRSYGVCDVELRAVADETIIDFYGHASTWKPYEMYGGADKGGWTEHVDKGAFKRTLNANADVPFLINHQGMSLARTKAGTLQLREDTVGLEVKAQLDTRNTEVNNLAVEMERKTIDEMSFAFRVKKQSWLNADGEEVPWWDMSGIERHLIELDIHKGDVSVVNFGANDTTDAGLRSLDDLRGLALDDCDEDELRAAIAYLESRLPEAAYIAPHPDVIAAQHNAAILRAELRADQLRADVA